MVNYSKYIRYKMKAKYLLSQIVFIVVITFAFFLMFLGILRTFELNDPAFAVILPFCEPKGFFGWGYNCDNEAYQRSLGYAIPDRTPHINWTYNFSNS